MLTISKPLSAGQAQSYHQKEFTSREQNYWSQRGVVAGEWQGRLAAPLGLAGAVSSENFTKLSQGQHPETGGQLVRQRASYEYQDGDGTTIKTREHRAGWDATFSAPKSVSLTALVGGDDRVREDHRESVRTALDEMERYAQARMGGNVPAQTTGQWAVAKFEHDSSRPVNGYAAPQLHTHAVIFNVTETADGSTRALEPQELYRTQQDATAVYRSELAAHLQGLGYEIERGEHGQPEIKGYTREYLEASSLRREQIKDHLREQGLDGAGAAQIAARSTRDKKELLSPEEVQRQHRELAATFGHQADRVVSAARERSQQHQQERSPEVVAARQAVT